MANVAELGIKIFLDDSASAGLNALGGIFGNLGRMISQSAYSWAALSPEIRLASEVAAGAGLAFLGFSSVLETSIENAAELQDTMANVSIAFNATDEETNRLQSSIETLAGTSRFSSDQVGEAFIQIGERGISAEDAMNHVGAAAIRLAEATHSQVAPATDLLASTMQIFGMRADEASKASDALTFAFYHGMPSASQLSQMISEVGYEAKLTGVSLEQLVVTMDYLTRSGVPASQASNSLRYILSSLSNPTTKAAEELANLGIILVNKTSPALQEFLVNLDKAGGLNAPFDGTVRSLSSLFSAATNLGTVHTDQSFFEWATANGILNNTLYDSNGKMHDLFTIINQLGSALDGLNPEQKAQALNQLFTVRGGKDAGILLNDIGQTTQALNRLDEEYRKFSGGAAKDAGKVTGTFNGQLDMLKTTIASFLATAAMPFDKFFASVIGSINTLIAPLANINGEFVKFFGVFLMVGSLTSATVLIGALVVVVVLLWGTLGPIILVAGGVVLAITALSAAVAFAITNWKAIEPILAAVAIAAVSVGIAFGAWRLALLIASVTTLIPGLIAMAAGLWAQIGPLAANIASGAVYLAQMALLVVRMGIWGAMNWSTVVPGLIAQAAAATAAALAWVALNLPIVILVGVIALLVAGFVYLLTQTDMLKWGMGALKAVFSVVVETFRSATSAVMPAVRSALDSLRPVIQQLTIGFRQAEPIFRGLALIVGGILVVALGVLSGIIRGLIQLIAAILVTIINVAAGIIRVLLGVVQFFLGFFNLIKAIVTGNGAGIQAAFGQMGQGIQNIVGGLFNAVKAIFVGAFNAIIGFITGFIQGVIGFFKHLFDVLVGHSIVPDMINSIISVFLSLPGRALSAVSTLLGNLLGFFSNLAGQVLGNIGGFINTIVEGFKSLPGRIIEGLSNLGNMLLNSAKNAVEMFLKPLRDAIDTVKNIAGNIANGIKSVLGFSSPPKEGPLTDSDQYMPRMIKMYTDGMLSQQYLIRNAAATIATSLHPNSFISPGVQAAQAGSSSGNSTSTYILQLDGKPIAQFTEDRIRGTLQMNGINRLMR
jgi:phage-related protein